jgi:hypothetical protein
MRFVLKPLLALVLLILLAAPANADSTVLTKRDPKGDVKIYKSKTISKADKKSIDIDKATIKLRDSGKYRFEVRLKRLSRAKTWDQMVTFDGGDGQSDPRYVQVAFKVRTSAGASAYNVSTEASCNLKVRRKGRSVWVDVPARCAPYGGQVIRVNAYTGYWQTDAPLFSRDRLNIGRFAG